MSSIITILIYVFIGYKFIRFLSKGTPENPYRKEVERLQKNIEAKRYSTINSHYSVDTLKSNRDINKKHEFIPSVNILPAEKTLHDDKKHDWLAQQLAEERRNLSKVKYMLGTDLSAEHSRVCDADGIDYGIGK